jgi:hypothetical protein
MGPIIAAIIIGVILALVAVPHPLNTILLIIAIALVLYGLWIIFSGFRPHGPVDGSRSRRVRWY